MNPNVVTALVSIGATSLVAWMIFVTKTVMTTQMEVKSIVKLINKYEYFKNKQGV